ncbi:MAG: ABC transporter permease, partial [Actinomycetota bacterium]|nr:ABC transporter permease [Actinomycetota bacterium]
MSLPVEPGFHQASPTPAPPGTAEPGAAPLDRARSLRADVWRRFRRNRLAMVGLAVILLLVLAAVLAPLLSPYPPNAIDTAASRQPPSAEHWFGTDLLGRDLFTRVLYGAQTSLQV